MTVATTASHLQPARGQRTEVDVIEPERLERRVQAFLSSRVERAPELAFTDVHVSSGVLPQESEDLLVTKMSSRLIPLSLIASPT